MWDFIKPANLIDFQRRCALRSMQEECARLLAEGYPIEADRVLDELVERKRLWQIQEPDWGR